MFEFLQALLGPVSSTGLAIVAGTVLLAGFIRGFVGFGAALIIVMVLSAVFGPVIAVPAANLSGLPATLQLLPAAVRGSERGFVLPFGLASFAAAPFGVMVLITLDPAIMRMAISVFRFVMSGAWLAKKYPDQHRQKGLGAETEIEKESTPANWTRS